MAGVDSKAEQLLREAGVESSISEEEMHDLLRSRNTPQLSEERSPASSTPGSTSSRNMSLPSELIDELRTPGRFHGLLAAGDVGSQAVNRVCVVVQSGS